MRLSIPLLTIGLAACATPAAKMTFGEAGLDPETTPPATATPTATPTTTATVGATAGPTSEWTLEELLEIAGDVPRPPAIAAVHSSLGEGVPGMTLQATLLRFASQARDRRATLAPSHVFPHGAIASWEALADDLGRYLSRNGAQTSLGELVRARITVEVELELDRRRFGAPPAALAALLADRLERLGRQAQAARVLGQKLFVVTKPPVLRWPIEDAGLSSVFGVRIHPIDGVRRMHWGIDLAAAPGRLVSAAAPGFVVHAGFTPGYGLAVEVRHDGELTSRYGHLSQLLCATGDRVEAGQPLGLVGATGRATGPHLHFEVWRGGRAEDPLVLLGARFMGSAAN